MNKNIIGNTREIYVFFIYLLLLYKKSKKKNTQVCLDFYIKKIRKKTPVVSSKYLGIKKI